MRGFVIVLLGAAAALSLAPSASAGLVIDQDQPTFNDRLAQFSAQGGLAQSFLQAHDNVAGAGIRLHSYTGSPSDLITIALWDKLPNASGATQLAIGSETGTAGSWVDVFFSSPVAVTPDTTLYLVFTSATNALSISGSTTDVYARGQAYAGAGYGSESSYDYTFRTYYEDAPAVVPVPGAVLLGALGLGTAGYLTRRRAA